MGKRKQEREAGRDAGRFVLMNGEEVQGVAHPSRLMRLPRYVLTLGLYGLWRKRDTSVVTNRRILLGKGVVSRHERSIPIRRVVDANYARKLLASYTELVIEGNRGREQLRVGPLTAKRAHRFASVVQEEI
jgi:hypothetical protein